MHAFSEPSVPSYSPQGRLVKKARLVLCAFTLLPVLLLGACTLAPTYVRPDAPIPNVFPATDDTDAPKNMPWEEFVQDENMKRTVGLALQNNRDLRIAMLNVEKTRAQYRVQTAELLPTIAAVGDSSAGRVPLDAGGMGSMAVMRQYSASLGFSDFELDLFGRIRSLREAAIEQFHSVENDAQRARLTLVAETCAMYLQVVADKELRDISAETYNNRKSHFDMVRQRHERGVASLLELNQAKTSMEDARATKAANETRVAQAENALALLMGAPIPANMPDVRRLAKVKKFADVPAGVPSTLLERRPDILAAEHRLKAYNANIGAARANFFPRISLTGALGTISADYDKLFNGAQGMWNFGPQVSIPLFDTGRNIALLKGANTDRDIAVATYEKTIQTAFREVADALVQRKNIGEQMDAQNSLLDAAKTTYSLADTRYKVGVDNQLTLLDAQRTLFAAEQGHIATTLLREMNALSLYKALGGGWY